MKRLLHKLFNRRYVLLTAFDGDTKIRPVHFAESGPMANYHGNKNGWNILVMGGKVEGYCGVRCWKPYLGMTGLYPPAYREGKEQNVSTPTRP